MSTYFPQSHVCLKSYQFQDSKKSTYRVNQQVYIANNERNCEHQPSVVLIYQTLYISVKALADTSAACLFGRIFHFFIMILLTIQCQIYNYSVAPAIGLVTGQISNDPVLDTVKCGTAVYKVLQNNSLMVRGSKTGLTTNLVPFIFFYTGIDNVAQLLCASNILYYVTTTGNLMKEAQIVNGILTFVQDNTVSNVKQMFSFNSFIIALTGDGLYAKGYCDAKLCLQGGNYITFTKLTLPPAINIADIASIYLDVNYHIFIFIYMKNGDVYATGDNTLKILPAASYPDTDSIRLIGTGFKNAMVGRNVSRAENTLYYMKGSSLYAFSADSVPQERVVLESIVNFNLKLNQLFYLKDQSVNVLIEESTQQEGTELYCSLIPNDPMCVKQLDGSFYYPDCFIAGIANPNFDYCKVLECENNGCPVAQCDPTNITCVSQLCLGNSQYNPLCQVDYAQVTLFAPLVNAKDYVFKNGMLVQATYSALPPDQETPTAPETQKSSLNAGAAAGIAIAICFVIFAAVLAGLVITLKKKASRTESGTTTKMNASEGSK
ncbi:Regulator_of chromosome condensation 1/beta-lactamase-inhibitor protein II [Hexamita inflata]|uniref:Regulator of chromosome condensation 1/beta-lactamase-inhibitor protein II n=1 Tax=Hexamita inflata TaxID=28002 RepID=A0AA86U707_9EUKA|nr:Regulator of chromosome condensation 1/beta-lactamase-inhibitor protein II [Hexamita inflata]